MNDDSIVRRMKKWVAGRGPSAGGKPHRQPSAARLMLRELDDRIAPSAVTSVTASGSGITAGTGILRGGQTVTLTVNFNSAVTLNNTGNSPTLTLNDGGAAAYVGGSGTAALNFTYVVAPGQNTNDLAVTAFNLNGDSLGGADVSGAATNPAGTLKIDTALPTAAITLVGAAGQIHGTALQFKVDFLEAVSGVDATDFALATTGVTGASITRVNQIDAAHYTVDVASGSGTGTIGLNIVATNNIKDLAGNAFGDGVFAPAANFNVGSKPYSVAISDVNGDGKPDLITANEGSSAVSVLLGTGTGSFGAATNFTVGSAPKSVAVGDVNGDGRPDIITANYDSGNVSVLLGTGAGSFAAAANYAVGQSPRSVAVGDVNGDGKPDIITANYDSGNVSILAGNGAGSFAAAGNVDVGSRPTSVVIDDVNGDNKPDLVVACFDSGSVRALLGNGSGSFAATANFDVHSDPYSVAAGDVNGDGKPDLVAVGFGGYFVSVLPGNGDGTFAPASPLLIGTQPYSVVIGDVNGDGLPDIITANDKSNTVSVLSGTGTGSFATAPGSLLNVGSIPKSVAVADVNGDGKPDLVTANSGGNNVSVLLNGGPQTGPVFSMLSTAVVASVTASGPGIAAGTGTLRASQTVTITVNFSEAVRVDGTNGLPTLTLNDGAIASYAGGSGTTALTFVYTVAPGQYTNDLTVTAFNLNGASLAGANVSAAAANPAGTLKIDAAPPVAAITLAGAASQFAGAALQFNVVFSEDVSGVDTSDFALAVTGETHASITGVNRIDAAHYNVSVASASGAGTSGTIGLNIVATNDIKDLVGNALGGGAFTSGDGASIGTDQRSVAIGDVNGDRKPDLVTANFDDNTVSVLLGDGAGSFGAAANFAVDNDPFSVVIGDVNGDGKPDLVTANESSSTVSVLLGTGTGSFGTATNFAVDNKPFSVAIGDVNGDGKLDLVTASGGSSTVSVLLGTGTGSFGAATNFAVGPRANSVAIGDVNGDGKPDLVTADYFGNSVSVLLGTGTGSFTAAPGSPFAVGEKPYSVAIGDVNGDGKPDLVVSNYGDNNVSVLLGTGTGSFANAPGSPLNVGSKPESVVIGDVNGDGKLDLVTANFGDSTVSVLLGTGTGSFANADNIAIDNQPFSVAIGDVNGDGRPDLVAANFRYNAVSVLLNGPAIQTGPAFAMLSAAVVTSVTASGLGITAGTGNLRAGQAVTLTVHFDTPVTVDGTNGLPTLTLNDGATAAYSGGSGASALTFVYTVSPGDNATDLAVTKFNLNGAVLNGAIGADLSGAAANPAGTLKVDAIAPVAAIALVGGGAQAIGTPLQFDVTFSEPVSGVDTGDFALAVTGVTGASITGVNQIDAAHYTVYVASGSGTGTGTISLNIAATNNIKDLGGNALGGGSFSAASSVVGGTRPYSVVIGDVNGDGKPDLVTANSGGNNVSVLLGNGDGTFSAAANFPVGTRPNSVSIGDVNGDGKPDLVTTNSSSSTVSILLGTGTGSFAAATNFTVGTGPLSVVIGDVNGDGKPDLVIANSGSDNVSVLLGTGTGSFAAATNFAVGTSPYSVAIGDVNGDGKPDVVTANYGSNNVSVLLGTGTGAFGAAVNFAAGTNPVSVAIGDVNDDGKPDLVTANIGGSTVSVLTGTGTGSFGAPASFPVGTSPKLVVIGDVNGDGKPDLVTANSGGGNVSVLPGTGTGAFGAAVNFAVGTGPKSVAIGDVNGDSRPDLVAANFTGNNIGILLNGPVTQTGPVFTLDGTTRTVTSVTASGPGITAGTGNLRAGQTVTLTVNFSKPVTINSTNGLPSLTLNDGATAAYAGGSGTTALTFVYTVSPGQNSSDLAVTAFNLNGAIIYLADVSGAAANPAGTLKIDATAPVAAIKLVGGGVQAIGTPLQFNVTFSEPVSGVDMGDFALATTGVTGESITDVNRIDDAHYTVDVASGSGAGTIGLNIAATNDIKDFGGNALGGGSFSAGSPLVAGASPTSVSVGDVNGDGKPDLVTANSGGNNVSVLLGNGDGTFGAATNFATGTNPVSVAIGDVNSDGKPDLITANSGGNNVSILLGNGDGTFEAATSFTVGTNPVSVVIGDVNGDRKPDIITANNGSNNISVLSGTGTGSFAAAVNFAVGTGPKSVAIGDVNGDGRADLVTANSGSNSVTVLTRTQAGSFAGINDAVGAQPASVSIGDINGDGKPDIVTANDGGGNVSVLTGTGTGSFGAAANFGTGSHPSSVSIGDVNGDGKPDLIAANHGSGNVGVLPGTGTGSFGAVASFAVGMNPVSASIGDVNGDGRPDIFAASNDGVDVLLNGAAVQAGPVFTLSGPVFLTGNTGTFTDGDGDKYTVRLTPANVGKIAVLRDGPGNGPLGGILLQDTDPAMSVLTITVVKAKTGDGYVGVGGIQGTGLKTLTAATSDITGDINLGGAAEQSTSIAIHKAGDVNISLGSRLTAFTAASAGTGTITAPAAGTLTITGDFKANVTLSGAGVAAGKPTLISASIGGLASGAFDVTGAITSLRVGSTAFENISASSLGTLAILKDSDHTSLTLSGAGVAPGKPALTSATIGGNATNLTVNVAGAVTSLKAKSFSGTGTITAASLGTLTSTGDFNSEVTLTGAGVAAGKPTLTAATIGGVASHVAWNVSGAIGTLKAKSFTGGGTITAASLGTLTSTGDFDSEVTLTGAGVATGKLTLGAASIGGIASGAGWNVTGAAGSFRAKSFAGSISANSLATLTTLGDFAGNLTLAGTGVAANKLTLSSASIGGTVTGSHLHVNGNVGTFTAKAFIDSDLFLGYTPTDPQNLMAGGTFLPGLKIAAFSVTGLAGSPTPAFSDSVVAADNIGAVTLKSVQSNNNNQKFGILAHTGIISARVTSPLPAFVFNKKNPTPQGIGDFEVEIF
ncbi:beta strand repeat-containing protein [Zavarzinella formosa]|uniref:beta strand repeat-containing protein n=1 Tax=Zavarzinella formosa TaxID=360055 RepID=UPI000594E97C|nr:VCBS repeat-containing protein [Zavarzinella formosa]